MTFGEQIKTLREKAGLTRHALALELNFTNGSIKGIEEGKILPTITKFLMIQDFFNADLRQEYYDFYKTRYSKNLSYEIDRTKYNFDPHIKKECLGCKEVVGMYCKLFQDPQRWVVTKKCYKPLSIKNKKK